MAKDEAPLELPEHFMSRLDRDSAYRIAALQCASTRANLREHLAEDKGEVAVWYEYFYNILRGDGDADDPPKREKGHNK